MIGNKLTFRIEDYYLDENSNKIAFLQDCELFGSLTITLKFTFLKNNSFVENFFGWASMKILETRLFNNEIKPKSMEVRLKSLDPTALPQKWNLQPYDIIQK